MAALINTQENQAPAPGSSNSGGDGNGLTKLSSGPAALAQQLIYEIMALYGEIISLSQEQKVNMVHAQSVEAQGQAQSTIASGIDQAIMFGVMGGLSIAGAAAGWGLSTYMERNATGQELFGKDNQLGSEVESMTNVKEAIALGPEEGEMNGPFQPGRSPAALRDEFAQGNFKNASDASANREAIQLMKQDMDDQEFDDWKTEFNKNVDQKTMNHNSATQRTTAYQQKITNRKDILSQVFTSGQNVVQAIQNPAKAQHDAESSLQQTATQLAGAAASDLGQAASKAFESQNAEIQILENINRTNSVGG